MDGLEFEMERATWDNFQDHYCYTDNPTSANVASDYCYLDEEICPYWGRQHPYEKWANKTGEDWGACFCGGEPTTDSQAPVGTWNGDGGGGDCPDFPGESIDCDGIWMTFSLCCCDHQIAAIPIEQGTYEGECKTCSYQFRTEWGICPGVTPPQAGGVCSCYDGVGGMGLETEALPPDPNVTDGHTNGLSMVWEHVAGDCSYQDDPAEPFDPSNFRMEYRLGSAANPVYWNCDCCFNTEVVGVAPMEYVVPKKAAWFTAIITPVDGCEKGGP
jgi:hypothetical protein